MSSITPGPSGFEVLIYFLFFYLHFPRPLHLSEVMVRLARDEKWRRWKEVSLGVSVCVKW